MRSSPHDDSLRRNAVLRRRRYALRLQTGVAVALLLVIGAFRFVPAPEPPPETFSILITCFSGESRRMDRAPLPLRPPRPAEVADSVDTDSLRERPLDFDAALDESEALRSLR